MNERKHPIDWLDAGLAVLAEAGADALTIARLSDVLSVSKGSFYHHFGDLARFKAALLERYIALSTEQIIANLAALTTPLERVRQLLAWLVELPSAAIERSMRGWAATDADVAATQARIDGQRIGYVAGQLAELTGDSERGQRCAQAIYAVFVGAMHIVPPLDQAAMRHSLAAVGRGFGLSELLG